MLILLEVTQYILQWLKLDDKIKVKYELCCPVAANYEVSKDTVKEKKKKKSFFKKLRNQSHIALHDSEVFWFIVISLDTSSLLIFFFWAVHSILVHICHSRMHLKVDLHLLLQLRWMKLFCMKTRQFSKDVFNCFFFWPLFSKNSHWQVYGSDRKLIILSKNYTERRLNHSSMQSHSGF